MAIQILVAEDDANIRDGLRDTLELESYEVTTAVDGKDALDQFAAGSFDLILLDIMMPQVNGYDVCKQIRQTNQRTPIIFLTAKGEETDIVTGLELGADDYITKPFSPKELVARIRAVLRRIKPQVGEDKSVRVHTISIDPDRYEVQAQGKQVDLTFTEFGILYTMAKQPGRVFTRSQLVEAIHGGNYVVSDRTVDVQITSLRRKLGHCGEYVETIRRVGYRLRD